MIKKKAPCGCDAGAFDNVVSAYPINVVDPTKSLLALQALNLSRRHRLAPDHARVVAGLLFGEARA